MSNVIVVLLGLAGLAAALFFCLCRHAFVGEGAWELAPRMAPTDSLERLVSALVQVESGGNVLAYNEREQAVGPLQIRPAYLADANEYALATEGPAAKVYSLNDMVSPTRARITFYRYMRRYATAPRVGRMPTFEDIARIHNGGPGGHRNPATEAYWQRVAAELNA